MSVHCIFHESHDDDQVYLSRIQVIGDKRDMEGNEHQSVQTMVWCIYLPACQPILIFLSDNPICLPSTRRSWTEKHTVVICLIRAPGALARSNLIHWGKSWGSQLSNGGFRLKIRQLLKKLCLFWPIMIAFSSSKLEGAPLLGEAPLIGKIVSLFSPMSYCPLGIRKLLKGAQLFFVKYM